jgi:tetratricopeptide (TPR) repeat protein
MLPTLLLSLTLSMAADTTAADELFRSGRYAAAEAAYRTLSSTDPSAAAVWAGLGKSLLELHRTQEAVQYLGHALQLNPDVADTRLTLARALSESGNTRGLVSLVEPLYEKEKPPHDPRTVQYLIEGFYANGYYQRVLQLIAERGPAREDMALRRIHAVSLAKAGREAEAETACKLLMDLQSEALDLDVTLTWVEILYNSDRYAEALPWATKVASQQPRNPIAHLWKARLLAGLGQFDAAATEGELSVALAPELPFAHNLLLGIYRRTGRAEEIRRQADWLRDYNEKMAARGK